ncbi:hypothetical protein GCM10010232_10480 [Streptomyces amakusaensis]|uniref:DNA-binding protein n=1 Tax=Streptomyces amakusaensis TaxID=67271 RepID=A0ABW0AAL1_9ACTN
MSGAARRPDATAEGRAEGMDGTDGQGTVGGSMDGLLEAGGVLPLGGGTSGTDGTDGGGPGVPGGSGGRDSGGRGGDGNGNGGTDELTARAYRHPALDGRTVVRLVPGAIAPAEDLALEYLGFESAGSAAVGRVKPRSLGFPAWALVNDPANGHHALAVVKEMERLTRQVATKPGLAKEGFDEIGERLDRSVPQFLPTYYEQVGRLFLAAEARQQASVFFGKARAAEQRHALPVDEERLREVFLEFAGEGALSGKALREYAKGLAVRLSPERAYAEFRLVSAQRCTAGLTPYAGMLEDLRRLAKGAGLDAAAEEESLVREIIHTGAMSHASGSFWKSALPALTAVAAGDPAVRERLLTLLPQTGGDSTEKFDADWLALLERCGAFELLMDGTVPAAEWLSSWSGHRQRGWGDLARLAPELTLVEKLAERLIADGTPVKLLQDGWRVTADLDVLDLCLALGVPVSPPTAGMKNLQLSGWLSDEREGRRDLAALVADERFAQLLRDGVEQLAGGDSPGRLKRIAEHPALRTVLAGWLADRADDLDRPLGLPEVDHQLGRLACFSSAAVLNTAPEALARITAFSPAEALARTLRTGILDELGWPALEEAVAELGPRAPQGRGQRDKESYALSDAWPALVVRLGMRAVAVGPQGVLDRQTLSLPASKDYSWNDPTVRYIGGQWLTVNGYGDGRRGRWSGSAADVFKPNGMLQDSHNSFQTPSLELPDGSRTFGGRPVHAGDTSFASEARQVASDGVSVWVLHENAWWDYDPLTARRGRVTLPAFFDAALAERSGTALVRRACRLLPARAGLEASPFGSADGLLGWWVRFDPDTRTLTACSVDGARGPAVRLPADGDPERAATEIPLPPLRLPGGGVLHPRETRSYHGRVELYDAEGVRLASVAEGGTDEVYASGTPLVAPVGHWHALRPRDERGSAVLREVTEADAAALLTAVSEGAEPAGAVGELLPGITHPALIAGVAGFVAEAARHVERVAALAERAAEQTAGGPAKGRPEVVFAHDGLLRQALNGLLSSRRHYGSYGWEESDATAMNQLRTLRRMLAPDTGEAEEESRGSGVHWMSLLGHGLAGAAVRAASPTTSEKEREALLEFLDAALETRVDGEAVLLDSRGRLRTVQLKGSFDQNPADPVGTVRRSGARALMFMCVERTDHPRATWNCVEYDPAGAFGGWDGLTEIDSRVLGSAGDPSYAESLRRLIDGVREHGPLPYRPEQAREFAERVGVGAATAALVQLGLPGINEYGRDGLLTAEYLAPLGLKSADAKSARETLGDFTTAERRWYTGLLLPAEPDRVDELWTRGFDLEPLVGAWLAERGLRRATPPWLTARLMAEFSSDPGLDAALNPETRRELTRGTEQRPDEDGDLTPADKDALLTGRTLASSVTALRWLAYRLPFGDPLRAVLPTTLRMLRERLTDPRLLLDLSCDWDADGKSTSKRIREAHGLGPNTGGRKQGLVEVGDTLMLAPTRYYTELESVWVRAASVATGEHAGPDHPTLKLLLAISGDSDELAALRAVLGTGFAELLAADGPAGAAQHPAHSAPELVTAAAGRFGLSEDAAALYLMLLALPDPTDRNQAEWTGWKPARLKKARAELAGTELVVEAKRARAGRSLFLPGGWLEARTPRLPLESWKSELFPGAEHAFAVPDRPVAELFAVAWQRVLDGDAPGFEVFKGRNARRGKGGSR